MRNFHFETALLPDGWADNVVIATDDDGIIADMAIGAPCPPFTDRLQGIAVPGIPNLHSHAHQRAMAGLTQRAGDTPDSFWTWREAMYHAARHITPDDLEAIALHAFIEMLQGGYTHVAEFHYLHHQPDGRPYANPAEMAARIAAAATAAGIGLTLLPVLYAASGFDGKPPTPAQRRFATTPDSLARLQAALPKPAPGHNHGVAAHSLRAVPPPALKALLAANPTGPIHIHIAEQPREVEECLAATRQRPIAWLLGHAPVDKRWTLIHATHADWDEVTALARTGATAGLCPTTEADLGDGIFQAGPFQQHGGRYGVGSDSQAAASPFEELRLLEYTQRLASGVRTVLANGPGRSTGETLWTTAAESGATACAIDAGRIEIGARADITVLAPGPTPGSALDAALFAPRANPVRHVVVRGECVVRHGAHRLGNVAAERFRTVVARLAAA